MPADIRRVQPPLKYIPPRFNRWVFEFAKLFIPLVLRVRLRPWLPAGISRVEVENIETLVKLYSQFQAGKIRLIIAFRHPEVDDPLCMARLISQLPKAGRKMGIKLKHPVHSHFMYDRGMTLWAGKWLGWLFARLGGVPVRRGRKIDKKPIQTVRELLLNGQFPFAIAPEGATNGHSGIVSPLEPGVSQLAVWCVEDLHKANRPEEVLIVPVTVQYEYPEPPWQKLDWLLSKLEHDTGLAVDSENPATSNLSNSFTNKLTKEKIYYERIIRLAQQLVVKMEEFYTRFYHCSFSEISSFPEISSFSEISVNNLENSEINPEINPEILIQRIERLLDKALEVAEVYFGLSKEGTKIDRCRRLEEAAWNYIYRDDIANIQELSPLDQGLADWVASEADLRLRHMRLVESFVAVTSTYLRENPCVERFAEMSLLMFDVVARLQDRNSLPGRPQLGLRQANITVGQPISVTNICQDKLGDRALLRKVPSEITMILSRAMQQLIRENLRE